MPSPKFTTTNLDPNLLAEVNTAEDELEGLPNPAPAGPPNYNSIKDAIATGILDPHMAIPLPIPITKENFMSSLRAFELRDGVKYAIFVPDEMYDKLSSIADQLKGLPWGGMAFPAKFYPDGEVEILIGTLEQHLGWLEGNK